APAPSEADVTTVRFAQHGPGGGRKRGTQSSKSRQDVVVHSLSDVCDAIEVQANGQGPSFGIFRIAWPWTMARRGRAGRDGKRVGLGVVRRGTRPQGLGCQARRSRTL